MNEPYLNKLKENTEKQKNITSQLVKLEKQLSQVGNPRERDLISDKIHEVKKSLKEVNERGQSISKKIALYKSLPTSNPTATSKKEDKDQKKFNPLPQTAQNISSQNKSSPQGQKTPGQNKNTRKRKKFLRKKIDEKFKLHGLERETIKRIKKGMGKGEKEKKKGKERKPNPYIKYASSNLYNFSMKLIQNNKFKRMRRELIKANMEFVPASYISFMFFTTLISIIGSFLIFGFFLFFNLTALPPFIVKVEEGILSRFLKVFWILLIVPLCTYLFLYYYPSMERKTLENRINHELPFATIHMSAISGSLLEPSKIFGIIIETREYPNISKEFTKLLNEINIYGYDLVSSLRNMAFNSPSKKLAELFNGLATTITSGGDLPDFFDKRSQTLLFEYRLERERESKASETFMDIYISAVITAPMILMLLLILMRVSGLGISLSTTMITIIMVLGVTLINILFLTFLHLKNPEKS